MLLTEQQIIDTFKEVELKPEEVTAMAVRFEGLIQESLEAEKELLTESIKRELEDKTSEYLDYVVEEWCAENAENLAGSVKTELTEAFVADLKNLFVEHTIDVPDSDVTMLEEANDVIADIEQDYENKVTENIELLNEVSESKKRLILTEMVLEEGLTLNDVETLLEATKHLSVKSEIDSEKYKSVSKLLLNENKSNPAKDAKQDEVLLESSFDIQRAVIDLL